MKSPKEHSLFLLDDLKILTEQMINLFKQSELELESLDDIELKRHAVIQEYQQLVFDASLVSGLQAKLIAISTLDYELNDLCTEAQEQLAGKIQEIKKSQRVRKAYQQNIG